MNGYHKIILLKYITVIAIEEFSDVTKNAFELVGLVIKVYVHSGS